MRSESSAVSPRIGQHQQRVVARDRAEIAVARFGRMDELRGRAGGGKRRRDLARRYGPHLPMPLTMTRPLTRRMSIDRAGELAVERARQARRSPRPRNPARGARRQDRPLRYATPAGPELWSAERIRTPVACRLHGLRPPILGIVDAKFMPTSGRQSAALTRNSCQLKLWAVPGLCRKS